MSISIHFESFINDLRNDDDKYINYYINEIQKGTTTAHDYYFPNGFVMCDTILINVKESYNYKSFADLLENWYLCGIKNRDKLWYTKLIKLIFRIKLNEKEKKIIVDYTNFDYYYYLISVLCEFINKQSYNRKFENLCYEFLLKSHELYPRGTCNFVELSLKQNEITTFLLTNLKILMSYVSKNKNESDIVDNEQLSAIQNNYQIIHYLYKKK